MKARKRRVVASATATVPAGGPMTKAQAASLRNAVDSLVKQHVAQQKASRAAAAKREATRKGKTGMAKRKLSGAALAAYNRKRGIGSGSKALARRGSTSVVVVRPPSQPAKRRRRGGGRRRRSGGGGGSTMTRLLWGFGSGLGWGYAKSQHADTLAKIPRVASLGLEGTLGLALAFFGHKLPAGTIRRAGDELGSTCIRLAGYAYGRSNFQNATVSGDDDLSGPLDDDEMESDRDRY